MSPSQWVHKLLLLDAVVDLLEEVFWEVLALVDLAVVAQEVQLGHFVLYTHVVQVRVEHDDGEGEDVGRVWV